jgi:hypothetical protein
LKDAGRIARATESAARLAARSAPVPGAGLRAGNRIRRKRKKKCQYQLNYSGGYTLFSENLV